MNGLLFRRGLTAALATCGLAAVWIPAAGGGEAGGVRKDAAGKETSAEPKSVYEFTLKDIDGKEVNLGAYRGKVLLVVNVASKCGYTPQYVGLERLYRQHKDRGLVVLGVPANNFGNQEPGTEAQIKAFCAQHYGVTFPMFSKVSVKGEDCCPLYRFLTSKETNPKFAGDIRWNFTKFLVDRKGRIVGRFESREDPGRSETIAAAVEKALEQERG